MSPYSHIKSVYGCNECSWIASAAWSKSIGERSVKEYLDGCCIEYKLEHSFSDCVGARLLRFDFYLPLYNILIEYDGKQHYESIDFFGGDEGLKSSQLRDSIKNKYCIDNNIPLIRIRYDVPDIREYLIQELSRYIPDLEGSYQ